MDQRYSDRGSGSGGSSRFQDNVSTSSNNTNSFRTGRSNYGGGARGNSNNNNNNNVGGNPIGNWIQNRRRRHRQRQSHQHGGNDNNNSNNNDGSSINSHNPVGTEAKAVLNMQRNGKAFKYPKEGFVTPIEHSLLYAMIEHPQNYPESVVRKEIEEEEFDVYLLVNEDEATKRRNRWRNDDNGNQHDGGGEYDNNNNDNIGSNDDANNMQSSSQTTTTSTAEEPRVSYAQLSALLALSAEKNPSRPAPERIPTQNTNNNSSFSSNSRRISQGTSNSEKSSNNNATTATTNNNHQQQQLPSIGQALCKKLLKTITSYCTTHPALHLDRESEIREFLSPIEKQCAIKNEKAALQQLLPAYVGYTLSLVTGNPLPLLVGAVALAGKDPMMDENTNVSGFRGMGGRVADVETAGLLDECEWDDE